MTSDTFTFEERWEAESLWDLRFRDLRVSFVGLTDDEFSNLQTTR
jgi:hypothetical protein